VSQARPTVHTGPVGRRLPTVVPIIAPVSWPLDAPLCVDGAWCGLPRGPGVPHPWHPGPGSDELPRNAVLMGTSVTDGSGLAVVFATGVRARSDRIAWVGRRGPPAASPCRRSPRWSRP